MTNRFQRVKPYIFGTMCVLSIFVASGIAFLHMPATSPRFVPGAPRDAATQPTTPQFVFATGENTQIVLEWQVPASNGGSAITGYNIFRGLTSGSETFLLNPGNVTTYTNIGLSNGQTYFYTIAAVNGVGQGNPSSEVYATPADVPTAPRNLTASPTGVGQITLHWALPSSNGSSAITNYHIYQGTTPGGELSLATIGIATTYTSNGLAHGLLYYFKVAAKSSLGEGLRSNEANATTPIWPTAPRALLASAGNAQVMLNWTAPLSNGGLGIVHYTIYQGTTAGGEDLVGLTIGNVSTYTISSLTNGQIYYFKIAAVNLAGTSPKSNEASATPMTVPTAPRTLTSTKGDGQIVLNWVAPYSNGGMAITGYKIYRSTSSGTEILCNIVGNITSYTDMNVTNGQMYYYEVTAINADGEGPRSNEISATPSSQPGSPAVPGYSTEIVLGIIAIGFLLIPFLYRKRYT